MGLCLKNTVAVGLVFVCLSQGCMRLCVFLKGVCVSRLVVCLRGVCVFKVCVCVFVYKCQSLLGWCLCVCLKNV